MLNYIVYNALDGAQRVTRAFVFSEGVRHFDMIDEVIDLLCESYKLTDLNVLGAGSIDFTSVGIITRKAVTNLPQLTTLDEDCSIVMSSIHTQETLH